MVGLNVAENSERIGCAEEVEKWNCLWQGQVKERKKERKNEEEEEGEEEEGEEEEGEEDEAGCRLLCGDWARDCSRVSCESFEVE